MHKGMEDYKKIKGFLEKNNVPDETPGAIKVILGNYCNVYGRELGKRIIVEMEDRKATAYSDNVGIFMPSGIVGSAFISKENIEGVYNIPRDAVEKNKLLCEILRVAQDPFGLENKVDDKGVKITQPAYKKHGIDNSEFWHPGGLF